jgi:hypothetical protein
MLTMMLAVLTVGMLPSTTAHAADGPVSVTANPVKFDVQWPYPFNGLIVHQQSPWLRATTSPNRGRWILLEGATSPGICTGTNTAWWKWDINSYTVADPQFVAGASPYFRLTYWCDWTLESWIPTIGWHQVQSGSFAISIQFQVNCYPAAPICQPNAYWTEYQYKTHSQLLKRFGPYPVA